MLGKKKMTSGLNESVCGGVPARQAPGLVRRMATN